MSIEDEWACASLSSKYALYADRARHRVPDLFAEDAVLVLPGHEMRGREEIRKWFAPRPNVATLHFCTNMVIELLDADHARGSTHLLSLGHEAAEEITTFPLPMPMARTGGIYFDTFARVNGEWLFTSRRLEAVFKGPG
jgi:ketosteroid isomerase-like protein